MRKDSLDRLLLAGGLAAAAFAVFADPFTARLLMWIATNALLGAALRFVMLVGEFNMAVVAFYAIGAYTGAIATVEGQLPLPVALLAGAAMAGVVSVVFGVVTMRVKGPYFMLISFAFAEVLRLVLSRTDAVGGNNGVVGIFPPRALDAYFPAITILAVVLLLLAMYMVERSHHGKVYAAIRNNDAVVESVGVNVLWVKIGCLVISSVAAGLGGALYAHANNVISPGDFTFLVAVMALAYVKLGGESDASGAVLGALVLTLVGQFLMRFGHLEHLFYGAAILVAMLAMPDGSIGVLTRWGWLARSDARAPAAAARAGPGVEGPA